MNCYVDGIFTGHTDAVYALENGIFDHTFLSSSGDGFVAIWNKIANSFERPAAKSETSIYAIKLIESNQHLIIGSRSGEVYITDLLNLKPVKALVFHKSPIYDIQYCTTTNQIWIASGDGSVSVWNEKYELVERLKLAETNIRNIAINEENNSLLISCSDHSIRVFDSKTLKQTAILKEHLNSVFCTLWLDSKHFISGSRDAHLFVWEYKNNWEVKQKIPAHNFTINDIKISPDKKYIASGSRDKSIKIWDSDTMDLVKVLDNKYEQAHTHSVNKLFWKENETLLSCGDDKRIIKWKIERN